MKTGLSALWRKALGLPVWVYTLVMWLAWFWMCLALLATPRTQVRGMTQIVDSWGAIERVALWQDAVSWLIPRITWSQEAIAWSIRGAFVILFLLQALAFWKARQTETQRLWPWLIGPLGSHLVMWLMPPANSDVFYYSMSGSLAASDVNPYDHQLLQFPDHPLFPFNHWIDIGSVYGPVWTWVGKTILTITGPEPVAAITGYRVFMTVVSMAMVLTTYGIARRLTSSTHIAISVAVLVAWQPNMVFETTGQVHNDAFVMLLALLAVYLLIVGGMQTLRGAIVLAAISSATKFVTLPLLGLLVLLRVRELWQGTTTDRARHLRALVLDLTAIFAVYVAAFALFWVGPSTVGEMLREPSRLYSHPFWRLIEWTALETVGHDVTQKIRSAIRVIMMLATVFVFVWATLRTLGWKKVSSTVSHATPLAGAWQHAPTFLFTMLVVEVTLSLVPVNAHPWYQVWSAPFVGFWTIYGMKPESRKWVGVYILIIALFTIMYHTRLMS